MRVGAVGGDREEQIYKHQIKKVEGHDSIHATKKNKVRPVIDEENSCALGYFKIDVKQVLTAEVTF